ncbi:MAG: hypothetical protein PUC70_01255 [bacterium]|nr:hypothetical protein [bacterium]
MNVKNARFKLLLTAFSSLITLIITSIVLTFAWFAQRYNVLNNNENISGSVLQKYFECGTGTQLDPFVITRPKHYENLVMLYYTMPGFPNAIEGNHIEDNGMVYERSYYFEIGYDFDGTGKKVYNYDNDGRPVTDPEKEKYSNILNLNIYKGESALKPLGSVEYPFISFVEGNNITLANFEINGSGFCDIGVFGYVGEGGGANNLYFDNYVINTTGATSIVENPSPNHIEHQHKVSCYTGYIAGHITNSKFFTNVYANNCEIKGGNQDYPLLNNYSYYGMVDRDIAASEVGSGKNYSFSLNSSAVYNYLNSYYDQGILMDSNGELTGGLKDTTMRVRNTEYDKDINDIEPVELKPDSTALQENQNFSQGIFLDGSEYRVVGDYSTSNNGTSDASRNYSLSTIGYFGPKVDKEENQYEVYYKDETDPENIRMVSPPTDTTVSNKGKNDLSTTGHYFYYDNNIEPKTWTYIDSHNTSDGTRTNLNVSFADYNFPTSINYGGTHYPNGFKDISIILYLDNDYAITATEVANTEPFSDDNVWEYKYTLFENGKVELKLEKYTFENVLVGTHNISLKIFFHWQYRPYIITHDAYYLAYYGNNSESTSINQKTFEIKAGDLIYNNDKEVNEFNYTIGNDTNKIDNKGTTNNNDDYTFETTAFRPIPVVSNETKVYTLYGKVPNVEDGTYNSLNYMSTSFYYEFEKWYANEIIRHVDKDNSGPVYIGDDPDIIGSGYNSKNIDIVGGGITFGTNYINISAEGSNHKLTTKPTYTDNSGNPTKFYATKYCPNSIVLYLKNVGGDKLGTINVNYTTIGAVLGISLKAPSFKKGGSTFIDFSSLDDGSGSYYVANDSGFDRSISINGIKPDDAKKISFCGIDENRNVVALYNSNGVLEQGGDENKVKYYVLCLGLKSTGGLLASLFANTRITRIDFSYKADEGAGGVFGSVGFRSFPNTIDSTILNFYYVIPSNKGNYSISVSFGRDENDPSIGRYSVNGDFDDPTTVKFYLYNTTSYTLSINNGEPISSSSYTYTFTPPSSP